MTSKANSRKSAQNQSDGIYIQFVRPPIGGEVSPQTIKSTLKKITPEQLQSAISMVGDIHKWLFAKLKEIGPQPDKVSLEFGIDAEGEVGVPFVTKGTIGANFKISMNLFFISQQLQYLPSHFLFLFF